MSIFESDLSIIPSTTFLHQIVVVSIVPVLLHLDFFFIPHIFSHQFLTTISLFPMGCLLSFMSFVTPSKDISKVNQVPVICYYLLFVVCCLSAEDVSYISPPTKCPYANVVIPSFRMYLLLSKQDRLHFVISLLFIL